MELDDDDAVSESSFSILFRLMVCVRCVVCHVVDCSWALRQSLRIPVIANGGCETFQDVQECLRVTGADAVMSAEGLLENPALFSDAAPDSLPDMIDMASLYLDKCLLYPCADKFIRLHLFKLLYRVTNMFPDLREQLGGAHGMGEFRAVLTALRAAQVAAGQGVAFYAAQPSWYRRHRTSAAAQQHRREEQVAQQAQAGGGGDTYGLGDDFGASCIFGAD